ncbi:MAG TPA: hypothetical protein VFU65_10175 [Actinocrinis sp.]|nr:hypothetical protein [Actinocrinis sp.]
MTVSNASCNGALAAGAAASFGFHRRRHRLYASRHLHRFGCLGVKTHVPPAIREDRNRCL